MFQLFTKNTAIRGACDQLKAGLGQLSKTQNVLGLILTVVALIGLLPHSSYAQEQRQFSVVLRTMQINDEDDDLSADEPYLLMYQTPAPPSTTACKTWASMSISVSTAAAREASAFFTPFSIDEARAFWVDKILPQLRAGTRRVLVARLGERTNEKGQGGMGKGEERLEINGRTDRIVGTVQLELEMPPNQQHRAAVAKLLVHPAARRLGIARTLMIALEEIARTEKRTLLTLDTVAGSNAELLYRSLDYIAAGVIPRYARGALTSELEGSTIMYKELAVRKG